MNNVSCYVCRKMFQYKIPDGDESLDTLVINRICSDKCKEEMSGRVLSILRFCRGDK